MGLSESGGLFARLCVAAAVLCLLAFAAGCGEDDSSDASAKDSAESGIPKSSPSVEVPEGPPPSKLVVKELSKGTGTEAKKGDKVALQYACIIWGDGAEYANSWNYSSIPTFVLGERARLLRGLNLAVPGMKEGGGREVLVPHTLLHYAGKPHSPVGPLDSVICKVYLVEVIGKKR